MAKKEEKAVEVEVPVVEAEAEAKPKKEKAPKESEVTSIAHHGERLCGVMRPDGTFCSKDGVVVDPS